MKFNNMTILDIFNHITNQGGMHSHELTQPKDKFNDNIDWDLGITTFIDCQELIQCISIKVDFHTSNKCIMRASTILLYHYGHIINAFGKWTPSQGLKRIGESGKSTCQEFKIKTCKQTILESKAGTPTKKAYATMSAQDDTNKFLKQLAIFLENIPLHSYK